FHFWLTVLVDGIQNGELKAGLTTRVNRRRGTLQLSLPQRSQGQNMLMVNSIFPQGTIFSGLNTVSLYSSSLDVWKHHIFMLLLSQ
ncbi:hypothetical protein STEG23_037673, partial [Scotinomys teguina]